MPKIKEIPEAPEMSDMEDLRTSKVDLIGSASSDDDEETVAVNGTAGDRESATTGQEVSNGHGGGGDDRSEASVGEDTASSDKVSLSADIGDLSAAAATEADSGLRLDGMVAVESPSDASEQNNQAEEGSAEVSSGEDAVKVVQGDVKEASDNTSGDIQCKTVKEEQEGKDDAGVKTEEGSTADEKSSALIGTKDQGTTKTDESLHLQLKSDPPSLPASPGGLSTRSGSARSSSSSAKSSSGGGGGVRSSKRSSASSRSAAGDKEAPPPPAVESEKDAGVDVKPADAEKAEESETAAESGENTGEAVAATEPQGDGGDIKELVQNDGDCGGEAVSVELGDLSQDKVDGDTHLVTPIPLDKLGQDMVPESSTLIEDVTGVITSDQIDGAGIVVSCQPLTTDSNVNIQPLTTDSKANFQPLTTDSKANIQPLTTDSKADKPVPNFNSLDMSEFPLDQVPVLLCTGQTNGGDQDLLDVTALTAAASSQSGAGTSVLKILTGNLEMVTSPADSPQSSGNTSPTKASLPFDKSQLFSKMNNTFDKDTKLIVSKRKKERQLLKEENGSKPATEDKTLAKTNKTAAEIPDKTVSSASTPSLTVSQVSVSQTKSASVPSSPVKAEGRPPGLVLENSQILIPPVDESAAATPPPAPVLAVSPSRLQAAAIPAKPTSPAIAVSKSPVVITMQSVSPAPILSNSTATGTKSSPTTVAAAQPLLQGKPEPMEIEEVYPEPPILEKQVEDTKLPPVLEVQAASNQPKAEQESPQQQQHQSLLKVVLTSPKKPTRSRKNSIDNETPLSALPDRIEPESSSPAVVVTSTPTSSSSDLTKSLRKVRLNKKSPTKQITMQGADPPPPQITSRVQGAGPILAPIPVGSSAAAVVAAQQPSPTSASLHQHVEGQSNPSSPTKPLSGMGTEIFDFTDEEDIPLNNIDLEALTEAERARSAASRNGSNLLVTGAIMSSEPLEISIPEHHALNTGAGSSTPPNSKSPGKHHHHHRYEVSPTILSQQDALAAVMAVHTTLAAASSSQRAAVNGDLMSDDTDNGGRGRSGAGGGGDQQRVRLGKRRKRRPMESDGGDTEDDLEPHQLMMTSKSRGDGSRPKRSKQSASSSAAIAASNNSLLVSGEAQHITRPSSAASSTASTREFEERRSAEAVEDGKNSPDSQKSSDEKVKAISTVVPEKASSFKIHPERTCADCCYYCLQKFGMLDTPLHIQQLKTQEKQEFAVEFTKFGLDACLCDRCFRFLDRRAAAGNISGGKQPGAAASVSAGKPGAEEKVKKCLIRTCNRDVTGNVSKKWLMRLKKRLMKKVTLDWDKVTKASVNATFLLCAKHSSLINFYSNCGLCKRKLTPGSTCALGMSKKEVEDMNILLREDNIPADLKENNFVCKLCKTFCSIKHKSLQPDFLKNHKSHKNFYKDYRKRLYAYLELGDTGEDTAYSQQNQHNHNKSNDKHPKKMFKVSQSTEGSCKIKISAHTPVTNSKTPSGSGKRNRKEKDFASPSSESKLHVTNSWSPVDGAGAQDDDAAAGGPVTSDKCAVNIQFDLNTKKLWQDLHYPYGNYTSFFRHLILLEKYWRSGDLTLAPNASLKSASYLKSVQNRITAYEGKQTTADLSANTRPDLEAPPAPTLTHVPGEAVLANLPTDLPSPVLTAASPTPSSVLQQAGGVGGSTILKIPKVPSSLLSPTNSILSPESLELTKANASHTASKIRVRQDLMQHLGLIPKPQPAIVVCSPPTLPQSNLMSSSPLSVSATPLRLSSQGVVMTTTVVATTIPSPSLVLTPANPMRSHGNATVVTPTKSGLAPSSTTPNLAKLLQDTNTTYSVEDKVVTGIKSSNSQLFKGSESTGAIPLTFNNSIAEVLAAAAGKTKVNKSREPSPKPEITITAKNSKIGGASAGSIEALAKISKKTGGTANLGTITAGSLSIQKKPVQQHNASINPITNMTKLLQSQAPGLPPHIIAQQTMPIRPVNPGSATITAKQPGSSLTATKIVPRAAAVSPVAPFRPVQLGGGKMSVGGGGGMAAGLPNTAATINKKSLTTVLDKLTSSSPTKPVTNSGLSSSLVQQLQAPLANQGTLLTGASPSGTSSTLRAQLSRSPALSISASPVSAAASSASTTPLPGNIIVPSSLTISSNAAPLALPPGVQLPSNLQLTPNPSTLQLGSSPLLQFPAPPGAGAGAQAGVEQFLFPNMNQNMAAQAAVLNMMASVTGLSQQQAVELLQQQQQLLNQQQQRIRGPPPLKNMGRKPD